MILEQVELPAAKQAFLKTHLSDTGHALLESVIESKRDTKLLEALQPAREARDYPAKLEEANAALRASHRYQTCLDVLKELSIQQTPFTLAKPV